MNNAVGARTALHPKTPPGLLEPRKVTFEDYGELNVNWAVSRFVIPIRSGIFIST